jgi:hypothetical protein
MSNILSVPQNFSTTLNVGGGINNSQTTSITLTSVTGLPTDGGILAFDWANPIDITTIEYIEYASLSSNDLAGVTRGQEGYSAKQHSNGCKIVGVISQAHIKRLKDNVTAEHDRSSGVHNNLTVLTLNQQTTPSSPSSGKNSVYVKSDGKVYALNSSGAETLIGPSAALDAWISDANTWTYSSVDGPTGVVTINADLTGVIGLGDRIKFTQTTVKYFIVTKISVSAGTTTLTFYGGTDYTLANAAITSPSYSHAKVPFGFNPDPTKWTQTLRDTSDRTQATPTSGTWYNLGSLSLDIPIGAWNVTYSALAQANTAASPGAFVTLSTGNNSESDSDFSSMTQATAAAALVFTAAKNKLLVLTAKTTYYLNMKYAGGTTTAINFLGASYFPTIIKAVSAYL